jgi:hypothetical protein
MKRGLALAMGKNDHPKHGGKKSKKSYKKRTRRG